MPLIKDLYPSRYLKADDIDEQGGEVRAIIKSLKMEEMDDPEKGKQDKPILYFLRQDKGLVLNKTNAEIIALTHGPDTDEWMGKEVLLITEPVTAFGQTKPAIRIRIPKKAVAAKPTPPATEIEDAPF